MRAISSFSVFKLTLLCFLLVAGGVLVHSCTLTSRACRDNIVCMIREQGEKLSDASDAVAQVTIYGYKCVDLLCKSNCTTDADCDTTQGYKCDTTTNKNGLCRCDVNDLKKPCHSQCFTSDECHARVDPATKVPLFPKESGWTCQANATNPNNPGLCTNPNEPTQEATPEEAGQAEEPNAEESQDD